MIGWRSRSSIACGTELEVALTVRHVAADVFLRGSGESSVQGYGHTKIARKQVLRKGLSPLVTMISTGHSAPVIAGMRLRTGRAGSGRGAGRMAAQAIVTARAAGASAAGTLAGQGHAVARGATLRGRLITVPARLARPARTPVPTPTQPLGLGAHMATAVGPDHRPQPTRRRLTSTPLATRPEHPISRRAGQTSDSGMPPDINRHAQSKPRSLT
jgi:hypothetical protein